MTKILKYTISFTLLLAATIGAVVAQNPVRQKDFESRFLVQFPVGRSDVNPQYRDNRYAIEELRRFFNAVDMSKIDRISITGSTSPEGPVTLNADLARKRAEALGQLITNKFGVDPMKLDLKGNGDTWPEMLNLIRRDENFPNKDYTLIVLSNNIPYHDRLKGLWIMDYRESYRFLKNNIFPSLRNAMGVVIAYNSNEPFLVYDSKKAFDDNQAFIEHPLIPIASMDLQPKKITKDSTTVSSKTVFEPTFMVRKPVFAFKTNLLFDALSLINFELEIPLGKRFSIAAEVIFPWWLWQNKQHCVQVFSANIEGRYWFGDRDITRQGYPREKMTGWFAGLYAGGGYYDLEWDRTGYQGEFFIAAGVSGGFAHTINKSGNLRFEYSLGVGYMQTNYRKYEAKIGFDDEWHLYRRESGMLRWIGPTRAKISFVWMINRNKKGGVK